MPAKRQFEVGDRVVLHGNFARIEGVERPTDKKRHPTVDMGRYTIRYEDGGNLHFNVPGYFMVRPGGDRR